jgi:hypothetical protein
MAWLWVDDGSDCEDPSRRVFLFGAPLIPFLAKLARSVKLSVKRVHHFKVEHKARPLNDSRWHILESWWRLESEDAKLFDCRVDGETVSKEKFREYGGGLVQPFYKDHELGMRIGADKDWEGYMGDFAMWEFEDDSAWDISARG